MVIIIDNKESDDLNRLVLTDDGTGSGLNIPTAMIGKEEGEAILGYMKDFPHKKVQVVYKFETN